jgi:septum formation protein
MNIILASASPRRLQLLSDAGLTVQVLPADIDETQYQNEPALDYVQRMAQQKAEALTRHKGLQLDASKPIVAADTIVCLDGQVFAKPVDYANACQTWQALGGTTHSVVTSVCIYYQGAIAQLAVSTQITLLAMTERDMHWYWNTGEPVDKAGAYAIQGRGARFVGRIEGSYTNVVGLPVPETLAALHKLCTP